MSYAFLDLAIFKSLYDENIDGAMDGMILFMFAAPVVFIISTFSALSLVEMTYAGSAFRRLTLIILLILALAHVPMLRSSIWRQNLPFLAAATLPFAMTLLALIWMELGVQARGLARRVLKR